MTLIIIAVAAIFIILILTDSFDTILAHLREKNNRLPEQENYRPPKNDQGCIGTVVPPSHKARYSSNNQNDKKGCINYDSKR